MIYSVRLCSDAFGIELEFQEGRENLITRLNQLFDDVENYIDENSDLDLAYRICIDIGEYDDEPRPKPSEKTI
jgi:hypothetical protein